MGPTAGAHQVSRTCTPTNYAAAELAVQTAIERFGSLTGLVNNAHASRQAPFTETSDEMWDLSFATGFQATRNFMLAAHPQLATPGSVLEANQHFPSVGTVEELDKRLRGVVESFANGLITA